jgi:hypothetical protein
MLLALLLRLKISVSRLVRVPRSELLSGLKRDIPGLSEYSDEQIDGMIEHLKSVGIVETRDIDGEPHYMVNTSAFEIEQ